MMKIKIIDILKDRTTGLRKWGVDNAPTILTVVGSISVVAGTVTACIQTLNLAELKEERDEQLDILDDDRDSKSLSDKEYSRRLRGVYFSWALAIGKNYIIPAALTGLGLGCIFKSDGMMITRCTNLGVLLNEALTRSSEFEERVRERFGDEVFEELKAGDPVAKITKIENGEEKTTLEFDPDKIEFDFVWTSGMGEYSDNDQHLNQESVRNCVMWINQCRRRYAQYGPVNDIYRYFGAYNRVRSEYDAECIGYPNIDVDAEYAFDIHMIPIEGTTNEHKRCPDYLLHLVRKPISCRYANIDHGFQAS